MLPPFFGDLELTNERLAEVVLVDPEYAQRFWQVLKELELAGPDDDRSRLARAAGEAAAVWVAEAIGTAITLSSVVHGRTWTEEELAERTDKLASVPVFRSLPAAERRRIAALLESRSFESGETVIEAGQSNDFLYIIQSGRVSVCRQTGFDDDGADAYALGPLQIFGEMSLLDGKPWVETVRAEEPAECWMLAGSEFRGLLQNSPEFTLTLLHQQAARLREIDRRLSDRGRDPVTGMADRPTLEYSYLRTAAGARRRGDGLTALVIQLENLPELEAAFGRDVRDDLVRQIAAALRDTARTADLLGRWSDDRFVLVLPDAGSDGHLLVKARIRRGITDLLIGSESAGQLNVRVGAAWAAFPPDRLPDLMAAAERALAAEKFLQRATQREAGTV